MYKSILFGAFSFLSLASLSSAYARFDEFETNFLGTCFRGGFDSPEQKVARAVDLLLSPSVMLDQIRKAQDAEAAPRLKSIIEKVSAGSRFAGMPVTWRDAHFLDDYSLQTSAESQLKILAERQAILIRFVDAEGGFRANSPIPSAQRQELRALARSLKVSLSRCRNTLGSKIASKK